jgi:hypothetical protein
MREPLKLEKGLVIMFDYVNHRGVQQKRKVEVIEVNYGENEYHPSLDWVLEAKDLVKNEVRYFAMIHMQNVKEVKEPHEYDGGYAGIPTKMSTLPYDTTFFVENGHWRGQIIQMDGKKHLLIEGDSPKEAKPIWDRDWELTLSDVKYGMTREEKIKMCNDICEDIGHIKEPYDKMNEDELNMTADWLFDLSGK